jgi:hypothetical protein
MSEISPIQRREFLGQVLAAAGTVGTAASPVQAAPPPPSRLGLPCAKLGKARISRIMLGGNLISGCMHSRDLRYVGELFRAYMTEEKILQTLKLAEEHGINTVFETGAKFVESYNRRFRGHMQFIPHINVSRDQSESALGDHIKAQVDTGAVALYVWGVAGDQLVQAGAIGKLARAVEMAKKHGLPVGVGGHSLQVPMTCEKEGVPCDFYVKTLHVDDYPSATPKAQRKEFIWMKGGPGWYDNMWCINPEETIQFMKTVAKPWVAFKVLAAGAIPPRRAFAHAFRNGADLIAVGMFDFQVQQNCELVADIISNLEKRDRPWRA